MAPISSTTWCLAMDVVAMERLVQDEDGDIPRTLGLSSARSHPHGCFLGLKAEGLESVHRAGFVGLSSPSGTSGAMEQTSMKSFRSWPMKMLAILTLASLQCIVHIAHLYIHNYIHIYTYNKLI